MGFWEVAGPLGAARPPLPMSPARFVSIVICEGLKDPPPKKRSEIEVKRWEIKERLKWVRSEIDI